jgi:hypothetical protein
MSYFYCGYNYVYACRQTVWKRDSKKRLGEVRGHAKQYAISVPANNTLQLSLIILLQFKSDCEGLCARGDSLLHLISSAALCLCSADGQRDSDVTLYIWLANVNC